MTKEDELTAGLQAELARVNARLAVQDAIVGGTGVLLDGKRIDPASIYAEPKIGCVNHDCDQCKAQQEPYAWEFIGSIWYDKDEVFAWAKDPEISDKPPLALYTRPQAREPLSWIATADQMPPPGVRVFWMDQDSNRVGYDTWMGDDFRFTPSHWMPIPTIEAAHGITKGQP